jgi:hypothetical protein
MTKEKIRESRLRTLFMDEIRRHPDCVHVRDVKIHHLPQPQNTNWEVAWIRDDDRSPPAKAWEILFEFQKRFELA